MPPHPALRSVLPLVIGLALPFPIEAKFTWEGCADFQPGEFRYVKVVTRTVDPTLD
jgi:hypothetical protein